MPEDADRRKFEEDYRQWVTVMAKEASRRLNLLSPSERERVTGLYRAYRDPRAVFRKVSDPARFERLAGDKAPAFVLMETEAATFAPSMYAASPGVLDFAVAMNRRLYYQSLWFPIIAFNSLYVKKVGDRLLQFALEHEFEMSRIYQEISMNLRALSSEEKREVVDSAQKISKDRVKITPEELVKDEKAMIQVSLSEPLIPKPYAETAMLLYLKDHFPELENLGVKSKSPEEENFGEELLGEFTSWASFSTEAFRLFVQEVLSGLRDANLGYG